MRGEASEARVPHPALSLDDAVHQKTRLALLTLLDEAGRADFAYLKRMLELTDGNLGRHIDVLTTQGLVETSKEFIGRRPRTWVTITPHGEQALAAEMDVLATLLNRFRANGTITRPG
jgi:DNA-binding MarR family transcriptional regulator